MRLSIFGLLLVVTIGSAVAAAADLTKIDRTIAKEPAYHSTPRYCLLVFGPEAKTHVWLVLDGDTLYADKNGNGDLTEVGERCEFVLKQAHLKNLGGLRRNEGEVHIRLCHAVRDGDVDPKADPGKAWELWLAVDGKTFVTHPITFAARLADSQVSHFGGPLAFQLHGSVAQLERGANPPHLAVRIGTPGLPARNSSRPVFAALTCPEVPSAVHPTAEVEFPGKTRGDRTIKVTVKLDGRC
jgi:hypothetical protein